jgi:hypothetical protein
MVSAPVSVSEIAIVIVLALPLVIARTLQCPTVHVPVSAACAGDVQRVEY